MAFSLGDYTVLALVGDSDIKPIINEIYSAINVYRFDNAWVLAGVNFALIIVITLIPNATIKK